MNESLMKERVAESRHEMCVFKKATSPNPPLSLSRSGQESTDKIVADKVAGITSRVCKRSASIRRLLLLRHFEKRTIVVTPQNKRSKMVTASCGFHALLIITIVNTTVGFSKWRMEEKDLLREPGRIKRASESFVPDLNLISTNTTYAEEVPNYPLDFVKSLLEREGHRFQAFFGNESGYEEAVRARRSIDAEGKLPCNAVSKTVYPKAATNMDGEWMFIIQNRSSLVQFVDVETCGTVKSCSEGRNELEDGSSICVQNYKYERLLALNRNGRHQEHDFKLPSTCVCAKVNK
ncbi:hypothetical protein C0J52_09350 [Blattella germanica]|nr:hypothetical protein C0J52_09350 [Blattella germanica]